MLVESPRLAHMHLSPRVDAVKLAQAVRTALGQGGTPLQSPAPAVAAAAIDLNITTLTGDFVMTASDVNGDVRLVIHHEHALFGGGLGHGGRHSAGCRARTLQGALSLRRRYDLIDRAVI